jgi:NADH dehydrogenase
VPPPTDDRPIVILGAGYAGLRVALDVQRRTRGAVPVRLIDRHPEHVLRTELYEVDRLAVPEADLSHWRIPLREALDGFRSSFLTGEVDRIDLANHEVGLGGATIPYQGLAICLGSVPAYYGVPGAAEVAHQVYSFPGARRLGLALREALATAERPLEVVVIGGGSTGTEVAAEIATARWSRLIGRRVPRPHVTLVTGALDFLVGLPPGLIAHARDLLDRAGVRMVEKINVTRVEPQRVGLATGEELPCDLAVWAAGVQAPPLVRTLPVPHGHSGRIAVTEHLEVPGHPGVVAVGDVGEFIDPRTGIAAPATAQAALAEAPVAAYNLLARRRGRPLRPFVYRERGVVVSVGVDRASGRTAGVTVWGRPAAVLKKLVERGYSVAAEHGVPPRGL